VDQAMLDKMARLARQLAITMYQKYLDAYTKQQQAASLADLCAGSASQGPSPPYDCDLCPSTAYGGPPPYSDSGADTAAAYGTSSGEDHEDEDEYDDSDEGSAEGEAYDHGHGHHSHGHGHHAHADPVSGYGVDVPGTKVSSGDGKKIAIIQMK
jgi:hypothetical protein